jgi:hypothetical protein
MEMTNEEFYDSVIAPALLDLGKQCQDRGISFVASVEYATGETGETATINEAASFKIRLAHAAMSSHGNVDSLFFWLVKYAKEHGHQSIILRQLGVSDKAE